MLRHEAFDEAKPRLGFVLRDDAKTAFNNCSMNENLPEAELRKIIQQQVLHELVGMDVFHPNFPLPVRINRKGLKHCISRRYDNPRKRLLVLPSLPELLTKATYLSKEADNHIPPRPGILLHKLQTTHVIQSQLYGVWLYVREPPDLLNFYDMGVVDL